MIRQPQDLVVIKHSSILKNNHLTHMSTLFIASPTSCTWLLFGEEEEAYLSTLTPTKTLIRFSSKFRSTLKEVAA